MEKELLAFLEEEHGTNHVSRLKHCFAYHFGSLDVEKRSVLEIGAGPGYLAALCLARGASRVVALDPESDGATEGVNKQFARLTESVVLGDGIEYLPISLEKFIATGRKETFDYILMCNVINHIDEDAVTRLHLPDADRERKRYIKTFEEIRNLLSETGCLLPMSEDTTYGTPSDFVFPPIAPLTGINIRTLMCGWPFFQRPVSHPRL